MNLESKNKTEFRDISYFLYFQVKNLENHYKVVFLDFSVYLKIPKIHPDNHIQGEFRFI